MDQHFKIITPVYNSQDWIGKCIESTKSQTYTDFEHIIVDDCSTDDTLKTALEVIDGDSRFIVIKKKIKLGVMHSHVIGMTFFPIHDSDPEVVFVHLDGDDWLAHDKVFEKVNEVYNEEDCWMTYGNYETTDGSQSVCAPRVKDRPIRRHIIEGGWPFSHLRTFKKFLWDKVKMGSLKDSNGKMFTSACDTALMSPMLEMAGDNIHFIKDVLYVYNRDNPLNEDKDHLKDQVRCAFEIVKQTPYESL